VIKKIVSLIVFLLLCNAAYRLGMVYFHDQQFKDAIREYAILSGQPPAKGDDVIKAKVMDLAQENQIPLDPDYVEVSRHNSQGLGEKITIKFAYAVMVQIVPGVERRFDFDYTTP
jgi:hypothetical protein